MTVQSTTRKAGPFNGNDLTTAFPFTFKVFDESDLQVILTSDAGADATLVLDSDYSVSLNADQDDDPGGTVTYPVSGAALPTGYSLTVTTVLAETQETDIQNSGGFHPNVIEDRLDYITILIQQHAERFARALLVSASDDAPNLSLLTSAIRAGKILGFDSNGDIELLTSIGSTVISQSIIAALLIPQTAAEAAALATPVDYNREDGNIERYATNTAPGSTDMATALQRAIDSRTALNPVVHLQREMGLSKPIILRSTSDPLPTIQGITLLGNCRAQTIINPLAADIKQPAQNVNALIINQNNNTHLHMEKVRFLDAVAYNGKVLYCEEGGGADGKGQALFSAVFRDVWFSLSSNNSGLCQGGFSNLLVQACAVEGLKNAAFWLKGLGNGDLVFTDNICNFGYDSFIYQEPDDKICAMVRVDGLHVYQWLRGRVVDLCKAREVTLSDITLECDAANVGDLGIAKLKNTLDFTGDNLKMVVANSGVRGDVGLEINGSRGKVTSSKFVADVGLKITSTSVQIGNATSANPVVFSTSTNHGLTTGQRVTFLNLPGDFGTAFNSQSFQVTVTGDTSFSVAVNGGAFAAYTSGGTVQSDFELELDNVDFTGCEYTIQMASGFPTGTLRTRNCKFNDSRQYGLLCSVGGLWNWYSDNDEFVNAGMDGVATGRVLAIDTGGEVILRNPTIGRNTTSAAAATYIDATGTGTMKIVNPRILGTPPTAVKAGSQAVTFSYATGYGGVIASAATITLPNSGSIFQISGTTNITSVSTANQEGREITLIFQDALTFTDGGNLHLASSFVTTTDDSITLVCIGSVWFERARSVN